MAASCSVRFVHPIHEGRAELPMTLRSSGTVHEGRQEHCGKDGASFIFARCPREMNERASVVTGSQGRKALVKPYVRGYCMNSRRVSLQEEEKTF